MADIDTSLVEQIFDLPYDNGKRAYIMTAKRMISGDVLKYRNGFFIPGRYETCFRCSSNFALTLPRRALGFA